MKKLLKTPIIRSHLVTGIALLLATTVTAQEQPLYSGTKTPYQPQQQKYTPPPAGYAPVFVNHVGRHGARFLTKAGSDAEVLQVLEQAGKTNALTPLGKQILAMTQRFIGLQKNNYENITGLGAEEQTGIGKRLLSNYGAAFKGNGLEIFATHKVRTQQSANALLEAFAAYKGKKQYEIVPDSADVLLRFYDLSPAYQAYKKSAPVKQTIDSLYNDAKTKSAAQAVCARLFTGNFNTNTVSFATSLYDVYCAQLSVPVEMQQHGYPRDSINFGIAFKQPELQWFCFINGAEDFIQKGAGTDTLGIQVEVATPLLANFIQTTTDVVNNTRTPDAILRFTHAEAISPFATLLGIPQASVPVNSIYDYNRHWSAANIIPLSANIQWILYSNGTDYLLKVLLNEKETELPVATTTWPYYKWNDVKTFYQKKLNVSRL